MEITKKERILLINQYKILKALDTENTSKYEELIEILENGFEILYGQIDEWISDDMPSSEGKLVLDILSIYRIIEFYKQDNPDDLEVINHDYSTFLGFDGNNEAEYLSFTEFLIEHQGKFSEQLKYKVKNDHFNSHFSMINKYKNMVAKWKEFQGESSYSLSKEKILQILEA